MHSAREINKTRPTSDNFKSNLGYVHGNFIKIVWFNKNLSIVVIYVNKLKITNNYTSHSNFFFSDYMQQNFEVDPSREEERELINKICTNYLPYFSTLVYNIFPLWKFIRISQKTWDKVPGFTRIVLKEGRYWQWDVLNRYNTEWAVIYGEWECGKGDKRCVSFTGIRLVWYGIWNGTWLYARFITWSDQNKSLTYVFAFKFKQTLLCSKKTLKVLTKY